MKLEHRTLLEHEIRAIQGGLTGFYIVAKSLTTEVGVSMWNSKKSNKLVQIGILHPNNDSPRNCVEIPFLKFFVENNFGFDHWICVVILMCLNNLWF